MNNANYYDTKVCEKQWENTRVVETGLKGKICLSAIRNVLRQFSDSIKDNSTLRNARAILRNERVVIELSNTSDVLSDEDVLMALESGIRKILGMTFA